MSLSFKPEDKFIFETGNNSVSQIVTFIDKMKTVFNLLSDEEIDEYNNIYNDKPTEDFIKWINQKYEEYLKNE